jgi:23S rRNA U2552 (ribose-2'-O)-methylase RlmE/FtsJ
MSYYLLPHISNTLQCDDINIEMHDKLSNNICKTTHKYLSTLKKEIESHTDKWDIYKKFTNTYEYIHTQIPGVKQSISKYKPVSRAYFKFVEIVNIFNIIPDNRFTISTFHLCEGPGGFIEAICHLRNNHNDTFNGMTLIGVDDNIPGWKKNTRLLKNNPKIHLEYGHDNTGDIINYKNYLHTVNKFKNSMTIITGDGGFDFSSNFNNQESMSSKLILAQILYAISMQSYKGHFILKIFDIFFKSTIQLIYILNLFYDCVYIFKPQTSRLANSEKYIVCKYFKFASSEQYINEFSRIIEQLENSYSNPSQIYISSILNTKLPLFFTARIEEISNVLCQFQINVIQNTISLIKYRRNDLNKKIEELIKNNITRCIQWCVKNNIGHNKNTSKNNIYIDYLHASHP